MTASVEITRELAAAGAACAVLPRSACLPELDTGRPRYGPIREPARTREIGVATTAQLTVPCRFSVEVGAVIRDVAEQLTSSGRWPAELKSTSPWVAKRV